MAGFLRAFAQAYGGGGNGGGYSNQSFLCWSRSLSLSNPIKKPPFKGGFWLKSEVTYLLVKACKKSGQAPVSAKRTLAGLL